jgi:hypothetical protein
MAPDRVKRIVSTLALVEVFNIVERESEKIEGRRYDEL